VKQLPTPPNHFRWTSTPGTRRLKVHFDGDWLSPRSKDRTRRTIGPPVADTIADCKKTPGTVGSRLARDLITQAKIA
jgi:hypothetical protein